MDTTFKKSAITPKLGQVRPSEVFWDKRRELDEKTVADLVAARARDGRFLHPIVVRDEGPSGYRLVSGYHRLEASKRHSGEQAPIPAIIYPSDTPDALITVLEIEENLLRKELTAAERERQTILLAAALKKLDEERSLPPVSDWGEAETGNLVPRLASTSGGRGNKGVWRKESPRRPASPSARSGKG